MNSIKKIWHDPVFASVISAGIVAITGIFLTYAYDLWPAVKGWLLDVSALPNWLILLLTVTSASAALRVFKIFANNEGESEALLKNAADETYSVTSLLRDAKKIAQKRGAGAHDFLQWIELELNGGYKNLLPENLPPYRRVYGDLRALNPYHGWQPVQFETAKIRESLTYAPAGQDVGSIEKLLSTPNNSFQFTHSPKQKQILMENIGGYTDVQLTISRASLEGIVSAVRSKVYDWISTHYL